MKTKEDFVKVTLEKMLVAGVVEEHNRELCKDLLRELYQRGCEASSRDRKRKQTTVSIKNKEEPRSFINHEVVQNKTSRNVTWYGQLDKVWEHARVHMPCSCGTDAKWEQTIRGDIYCPECKWNLIVDKDGDFSAQKAAQIEYDLGIRK